MQNPLKDKDAAVVAVIVNVLKTLKHELTEELHKGQRIAHLKERPQVGCEEGERVRGKAIMTRWMNQWVKENL